MHSLDTVKTRQQGAPNVIKYRRMLSAYKHIFIEEGVRKGLYGGYSAAMLGSLPSAAIFFGTYEFLKRTFIDRWQLHETSSHLVAGFMGDFMSSFIYVPSEVLKARLQLQGRYNNQFFYSGYNYKNMRDAVKCIVRDEGFMALFYGYKATLARDLPFSALQFAFYEKFRQRAFALERKDIRSKDQELTIFTELLTGAAAGGLAGIITTPLDVVKTRLQTQQTDTPPQINELINTQGSAKSIDFVNGDLKKPISLSNSILRSLRLVYGSEGIIGCFSGVGPRFVWTSVQSSIMLLIYQMALKTLGGSSGYVNS